MKDDLVKIRVADIYLDESIYPRENIDHKRINIFVENLRDEFLFDPIEVQLYPGKKGRYRILDGAHRWSACKKAGQIEINAIVKTLYKIDPLLYAAKMAIGPRQLTEVETKNTARRAFNANPKLTSSEIGKSIGRSRQTVDSYIADLRATNLLALGLKVFHLNQLGIPQERIAKRLDVLQQTISSYLQEMPEMAFLVNSDLAKGYTVPQVAQKHGWPEPLVWSQSLKSKGDQTRFKELNWALKPWDVWDFNDGDKRFGDARPNRMPAQVIAHILYFFSKPGDLVFDPMAGGGVCPDTCLAMERRCWSLDMDDRPDTRPEIEPWHWDLEGKWENLPIMNAKKKPDLIIWEPPRFDIAEKGDGKRDISGLSKTEYLRFFEKFFFFLKKISKKKTRLGFIFTDFRDYENCPADQEDPNQAILIDAYCKVLKTTGWKLTHIIQTPLSSERFSAELTTPMQKKRILGVTSRYVLILKGV
ncbi:MAG: HTH domain-containing protein [Desulfobacula sp.]|jgi:ParB/RepB/Spo0J family partition protein|nr:HTH domain-containing protein [Desulfobacula sp.]MBT6341306.1 HTH domain-containing protein [Desulfobacula sp.]MBT7260525.1 HTH domain-containing protein [Desulfobacula sp.]